MTSVYSEKPKFVILLFQHGSHLKNSISAFVKNKYISNRQNKK